LYPRFVYGDFESSNWDIIPTFKTWYVVAAEGTMKKETPATGCPDPAEINMALCKHGDKTACAPAAPAAPAAGGGKAAPADRGKKSAAPAARGAK